MLTSDVASHEPTTRSRQKAEASCITRLNKPVVQTWLWQCKFSWSFFSIEGA